MQMIIVLHILYRLARQNHQFIKGFPVFYRKINQKKNHSIVLILDHKIENSPK
jgi:hypothetical protein